MDFIVVRLGKDSVADINKIDGTSPEKFEPFILEFTCKQVEQSIQPGAFALLYLGSDNNKGTATDWKQGLRALGILRAIVGWENFQSTCTLRIEVFSNFPESLDQISFLEKSPTLYKHFSNYPVIGVKSSRNNSVQKVNEGPRQKTPALLTAILGLYPNFQSDLEAHAPELISMLGFVPEGESQGEGASEAGPVAGKKASNVIFYGAPGTGKSYAIDKTVDSSKCVNTVFHPETMNADFMGAIKPVMMEDGGKKYLTYEYLPGPFLKAIVAALNDHESHYWLVIEEINRAPAAAVFGEVFQLLDRDSSGRSTYEIDFPDSLCENYVNSRLKKSIAKLFIPENLSLLASMNSSDQGVLPLDTAFKRRWKFIYIPLDFDKGCTDGDVELVLDAGVLRQISWQIFATCVNRVLADASIPEDRHLGPYFLTKDDLEDKDLVLTGKLFMYLWDDVLRHGLRYRIFDANIKTYGQLVSCWNKRERVFNDEFIQIVMERAAPVEK